ncbi:MAG: hypothetical protein ACOCVF_00450, partial [bacterium]
MNEENNQSMQNKGTDPIQQMLSDYRNRQTENKKKSSSEILAKYFTPRKPKETFRILPKQPHQKHYWGDEVYFHVVTTNMQGGKKRHGTKIYCLAHNEPKVPKLDNEGNPVLDPRGNPIMVQPRCPLCEKSKEMLKQQDNSIKGKKEAELTPDEKKIYDNNKKIFIESKKWEAKKFYVVRGIDKGAEKDGVKFWRFKHNFKNQGVLEKLMVPLEEYYLQYGKDFSSPTDGCDLSISTAKNKFNNIEYTDVTAITARQPSPLHNDPIIVDQWLNDPITWREVYKPKKAPNITPETYMEMVAVGIDPYFDKTDSNNMHWVFPNNPELQELANTRNADLDADSDDNNGSPNYSMNEANNQNVGNIQENAVSFGGNQTAQPTPEPVPKQPEPASEPVQPQQENAQEQPSEDVD